MKTLALATDSLGAGFPEWRRIRIFAKTAKTHAQFKKKLDPAPALENQKILDSKALSHFLQSLCGNLESAFPKENQTKKLHVGPGIKLPPLRRIKDPVARWISLPFLLFLGFWTLQFCKSPEFLILGLWAKNCLFGDLASEDVSQDKALA